MDEVKKQELSWLAEDIRVERLKVWRADAEWDDDVEVVRASDYDQLREEVEALRERAGKYETIERVMKMLECDEREGGIWTACTLLLIGSAHKMNSAKSVVDQEGVTVAAENLGNWRVTVERIDAAMAKDGSTNG